MREGGFCMKKSQFTEEQITTKAEMALIRFFHCMDSEEKASLLDNALTSLTKRLSLEENRDSFVNWNLEEELTWSLEERLLRSFPFDWPNQDLVDLDNVGDPGFWLENFFNGCTLELFLSTLMDVDNLKEVAVDLSEKYITATDEAGYDLGIIEFDGGLNAFQEAITKDFANAIEFWHEKVLNILEIQENL